MSPLEALQVARKALEELSCLGNGLYRGNSVGNEIAASAYDKTADLDTEIDKARLDDLVSDLTVYHDSPRIWMDVRAKLLEFCLNPYKPSAQKEPST